MMRQTTTSEPGTRKQPKLKARYHASHDQAPFAGPLPGFKKLVAVIGGGMAGICAARHLLGQGLQPIIFEAGETFGGVWVYNEDPDHGKMYRSLCTNTNRQSMEFPDLPMPSDWQDYPQHGCILQYLQDYAAKHRLHNYTVFRARVTDVSQLTTGRWEVTYNITGDNPSPCTKLRVDAVVMCTGQTGSPYVPEVKGSDRYQGNIMHSSTFRDGAAFKGQRVLVVGMGIASGPDIAQEVSYSASCVSVSTRHGITLLPRYLLGWHRWNWIGGQTWWIYFPIVMCACKWLFLQLVRITSYLSFGDMTPLGLRAFDPAMDAHNGSSTYCTDSHCFPQRVRLGYIVMRPGLASFTRTGVKFTDGQEADFDTVIFATGYHRSTGLTINKQPFDISQCPLTDYTWSSNLPGIAFCLYVHPVGSHFQVAWVQAKWIAAVLSGIVALPGSNEMCARALLLAQHQGSGTVDAFSVTDNFADRMGLARPSFARVVGTLLFRPAGAIAYLTSPRWKLWFPYNALELAYSMSPSS